MMKVDAPRQLAARIGFLFVMLATLALLCSAAFAQTTVSTGSIVGTVTDSTGAVVRRQGYDCRFYGADDQGHHERSGRLFLGFSCPGRVHGAH